MRNALINNFESLELRPDLGALFENFFISEYAKKVQVARSHEDLSFWRAYSGSEIDLILEKDGHISGYDMKWKYDRSTIPMPNTAPLETVLPVTRENFMTFL